MDNIRWAMTSISSRAILCPEDLLSIDHFFQKVRWYTYFLHIICLGDAFKLSLSATWGCAAMTLTVDLTVMVCPPQQSATTSPHLCTAACAPGRVTQHVAPTRVGCLNPLYRNWIESETGQVCYGTCPSHSLKASGSFLNNNCLEKVNQVYSDHATCISPQESPTFVNTLACAPDKAQDELDQTTVGG